KNNSMNEIEITDRDERGRFIKGSAANPKGKPVGTVHHTTKEVRQILTKIIAKNLDTVEADIAALSPKDRIAAIIALANIVLPKLSAVAVAGEDQNGEKTKQVFLIGETRIEF